MKEIILASSSPRRKWLLEEAGYRLRLVKSHYEETNMVKESPYEMVMEQALGKARKAVLSETDKNAIETGEAVLIGADTIVILDRSILGKPKDVEEAKCMLRSLSGRSHEVATGVAIYTKEEWDVFVIATEITFHKLSESQISDYIRTFSPLDKCGAYGIHELDEGWVQSVKGSKSNVIGLPMEAVTERLAML